jgi:hypothetical protein
MLCGYSAKPGDLIKNLCFLDLYPTADSVNHRIPDDGIPKDSICTVLSPPNGTWIKVLCDGRVGWVNWRLFVEVLQ